MTPRVLLEVAVASADDAATAAAGGADRLELSAALELDGLTPSPGVVAEVRRVTDLPLVVLLRPRPGGFAYNERELSAMLRDLEWIGGDVAAGVLTPEGEIDVPRMKRFPAERVVFHRAFDLVPDPPRALEQLIDLGVRRVMASADPDHIARLLDAASGRIEVLPAGGVRPENVRRLVERSGCSQVHGSFKRGVGGHHETCGDAVRRVRAILGGFRN